MLRNLSSEPSHVGRHTSIGSELRQGAPGTTELNGVRTWSPADGQTSRFTRLPVVIAGCRESWHLALQRELSRVIDAELCAHTGSKDLIESVSALDARGRTLAFALLETSSHAASFDFLHSRLPEVPIVAIGNGDRFEERIHAALHGVAAFLSSPISIHRIVEVAMRVSEARAPGTRSPSGERLHVREASK